MWNFLFTAYSLVRTEPQSVIGHTRGKKKKSCDVVAIFRLDLHVLSSCTRTTCAKPIGEFLGTEKPVFHVYRFVELFVSFGSSFFGLFVCLFLCDGS